MRRLLKSSAKKALTGLPLESEGSRFHILIVSCQPIDILMLPSEPLSHLLPSPLSLRHSPSYSPTYPWAGSSFSIRHRAATAFQSRAMSRIGKLGEREASSSRTAERPSPPTSGESALCVSIVAPCELLTLPVASTTARTLAASFNHPKPMAITLNKAKELVDDLLQALDSNCLAAGPLASSIAAIARCFNKESVSTPFTYAGQLGDYTMELLKKATALCARA